mgnify:CR=1 FL=1
MLEKTLKKFKIVPKEELGIEIKPEELELMMSYKRNHDFVDVYLVRKDIDLKDITMQTEEVSEVKWASKEELEDLIKENQTPKSLQIYFEFLKNLIKSTKSVCLFK